ncbi:hypothetical protein [Thalassoroseus pseudoceratinae]|uniref:hypothetical protein n=1 Tax=Thalassoroseus pseudoceratinae TaxID=2713176 RepID=UPI00141FA841|nr:hypothetical protein [Thalassoroseus pseudoceratinae]
MKFLKITVVLLLWGAALIGVLQLKALPVSPSHSVCGPWGCGPEIPSLLAYHGFWLVVLSLPTILVCRHLSQMRLRRLGVGGVVLAILCIVAICIWQRMTWWPDVTDWQREYFVKRCMFVVITAVDWPVLQILFLSTLCGLTGWFKRESSFA